MSEERSLKTSSAGSKQLGPTRIIRPSELAKTGTTGEVASGVLEKIMPNKFNEAKNDYFIRGSDDTLYIINETASLKEQLGQDGVVGSKVRVVYNGKKPTKKGNKSYHDFDCYLVTE